MAPKVCKIVFLLAALGPMSAAAFSWEAHAIIAARATTQLTPEALSASNRLLRTLGAISLVEIAAWADKHKNRTSARWHYVNLPPGDCAYQRERDCADGECLVEAIHEQSAILADDTRSDLERAHALRYLVHLVGDAFQPLHAGYEKDKGGNTYQINVHGHGTNLHAFWDGDMLRRDPSLRNAALSMPAAAAILRAPEAWVMRSCHLVQSDAFYPRHKVRTSYVVWAKHVFVRQLAGAGDQLAQLINASLDGTR